MGLVKTFLQIAVTLSLAVFISTPSVADNATKSECQVQNRKDCNNIAGCFSIGSTSIFSFGVIFSCIKIIINMIFEFVCIISC